jgi:hypothetical protein
MMGNVGIERSDVARDRDLAWAEAFAGLARVASTLSTRLRQIHETPELAPPSPGRALSTRSPADDRGPRGGLGPRQLAVLSMLALDSELGVSASDVVKAQGWTAPNSNTVLNSLEKVGALERVPDERPIRWRRPPP